MSGTRQIHRSVAGPHRIRRSAYAGDRAAAVRLRTRSTDRAATMSPQSPARAARPLPATLRNTGSAARFGTSAAPLSLAATFAVGLVAGTQEVEAAETTIAAVRAEPEPAQSVTMEAYGWMFGLLWLTGVASHLLSGQFASGRRAATWPIDMAGNGIGAIGDMIGLWAATRVAEGRGLFLDNLVSGVAHGVAAAVQASGPINNPRLRSTRDADRNVRHTVASGLAASAGFLRAGWWRSAAATLALTRWRVNRTATPEVLAHLDLLIGLVREHRGNWGHGTRTIAWCRNAYGPDDHFPAQAQPTRRWLRELAAAVPKLSVADAVHLRTFDPMLEDIAAVRAALESLAPAPTVTAHN